MKVSKKAQNKLHETARLSYKQSSGNLSLAADRLVARINSNRTLFTALMLPLVRAACYELINHIHRDKRNKIWNYPSASQGGDRVELLAESNLLTFPLPGGKPLNEASGEEVKAAAEFYSKQSVDMAHKARWLFLIAERVQGKRCVGEAVTEGDLRALHKQAEHE